MYAPPGYLVFARNGTLTALPFDLAAGRVTGSPVPIGGAVATESQFYFAGMTRVAGPRVLDAKVFFLAARRLHCLHVAGVRSS